MGRRRWMGWLAVGLSACASYQDPCEVRDHRVALVSGFTPDLQVSGDGEVWATGWQVEDEEDDDPSTQLAGVARFTPAGDLLASWTIPIPVLPSESLGSRASLDWAWTGERLATVRRVHELRPPDDDGEHIRSYLAFRAVETDGTAGPTVELPASCLDCQLQWTMRALAGRVAIVYQPRTITDDIEAPLTPGLLYYLLVDPAGQVTSRGPLPFEPSFDDVGRFEVDTTGLGFWLSTDEGQRLFDREMQLVAGPYATESTGPTPMHVAGSAVHAAWVDEADNVFQRSYAEGGRPLGPPERLSHGTAQAVRPTGAGLGVVLRDDGEAFFAWSVDDEKVGGDTLLPGIIGGWPSLGALFVDGDADATLFLGDRNQVDRLELRCGP